MKNWWFDADSDLRVSACDCLVLYMKPRAEWECCGGIWGRMADGQGMPCPYEENPIGRRRSRLGVWGAAAHSVFVPQGKGAAVQKRTL